MTRYIYPGPGSCPSSAISIHRRLPEGLRGLIAVAGGVA